MRWSDLFVEELSKARSDLKESTANLASKTISPAVKQILEVSGLVCEERAFTRMIRLMSNPPRGTVLFHNYDNPPGYKIVEEVQEVSIQEDGATMVKFEDGYSRPLNRNQDRVVFVREDGEIQLVWPLFLWQSSGSQDERPETASQPITMREKLDVRCGVPIGFSAALDVVGKLLAQAGAVTEKLARMAAEMMPSTDPPVANQASKPRSLENRRGTDA